MPVLPLYYTIKVQGAPLPAGYLSALKEVQVECSLERASVFRLHFELSRSPLGDWDVLQGDLFRPMTLVSISVNGLLGVSDTLVNGYVHSAQLLNRSTPGASVLEVVGMDVTASRMNLQERNMPWPNQSDSAIATAIFGQYGVAATPPNVAPTSPTRTEVQATTRQRGTDIRFLKDLARRNAYECFVQPAPIIGTDLGFFRPPQLTGPPQAVLSVDFGLATNTTSFDVHYDMLQPTSAQGQSLDPMSRLASPAPATAAAEPPMGREPALARIVPPPVVLPTMTDAANPSEMLAQAFGIANRSSRCLRGRGEVDGVALGRALRPGAPVLVRGAGSEHSGCYYVSDVVHALSSSRYTQSVSMWRNALALTGAEVFVDPYGGAL